MTTKPPKSRNGIFNLCKKKTKLRKVGFLEFSRDCAIKISTSKKIKLLEIGFLEFSKGYATYFIY